MKIKKYTASTMPEAMQQIRKELGSDAVILNSREVNKKGWLGFLKKKQIEVFAALDPSPMPEVSSRQTDQPAVSKVKQQEQGNVLTEIRHLKKMMLSASQHNQENTGVWGMLDNHLKEQDIEPELSQSIVKSVKQSDVDATDEQAVYQTAQLELQSRLKTLPMVNMTGDEQVVQFVGPTGVGKTTTLAKAAAKAMFEDHKQAAFITVDTYRIAAIDQLKTYARILNVPVKVAYNKEEYQKALDAFENYDVIFVDTPGRNFHSEQYVKELNEMIDIDHNAATYLVLSLTAKSRDMLNVYDQFKHLPLKGLIITKIDETSVYGGLLNITLPYHISIASLTNGQNVPDDMFEPDPDFIARLVMGGINNV